MACVTLLAILAVLRVMKETSLPLALLHWWRTKPQYSAASDSMTTGSTPPRGSSTDDAQEPAQASAITEALQAQLQEMLQEAQKESEARMMALMTKLMGTLRAGEATAEEAEAPAGGAAPEAQEAATTTTEAAAAPTEPAPAEATPAEATPAEEKPGRQGKLDEATMTMFWEFGDDDLMCAEDWIAHAEEVGKMYNLNHDQLCMALRRRAVGTVKAKLEETRAPTKYNWPRVCKFLIERFGRNAREPEFQDELSRMDKIAGMDLFAALDRVETLMAKTNHSLNNTAPLRKMLAAFPDGVGATVLDLGCLKKTWPEAVADIKTYAANRGPDMLAPKRLARPPPDATRAKSAGTVATVESAATPESATTGRRPKGKKPRPRCYKCGEFGHMQWHCPAGPAGRDAQSKN
jgi:hypothetical protein